MDKSEKGYKVEISDDAVTEALRSVEKYGSVSDHLPPEDPEAPAEQEAAEIAIEVESSDDSAAAPGTEAERLRADLDKARNDLKASRDRMLRIAADADNVRKRALRDKADAIKFGQEGLLRDLLPIIDNLERTLEHAPSSEEPALVSLLDGVRMVLRLFQDTLARYGVTAFDAHGQAFDPNRHEAFGRKETDEAEPNTVVEQMHRGYMLHDRLMRPALVVVACPNTSRTQGSDEPPDEA